MKSTKDQFMAKKYLLDFYKGMTRHSFISLFNTMQVCRNKVENSLEVIRLCKN